MQIEKTRARSNESFELKRLILQAIQIVFTGKKPSGGSLGPKIESAGSKLPLFYH